MPEVPFKLHALNYPFLVSGPPPSYVEAWMKVAFPK